MPTAPPLELLVIPHTHWDREWYHSAERFRQRLVPLIDELLDEPPPPGESFLLDGQAIVLEDYLAVRPERAAELSALLRDGRLEAGPWYVLADELIPGGEALVRNLLAGRDAVRRLRGEPPPVLYCPDSFGHPAILPELARGFGCELVVLWRGYGGPRWPAGDTVRWRGPSGAEVIVHHLPPDGYEFGSSLPTESAAATERWTRIAAVMGARAVGGVALLLNGADHHARQRHQHEAVSALADAARPNVVRATTLRDAATTIVDSARRVALPVIEGELRDSYGYTWTLQGTFGTRAVQKRRNALAERLLVRDAEPWIALMGEGGSAAARALLAAAWRTLLRAHPHDTLCGTAIDAVATALDERVASAMVQGMGLRDDALLALLGHDTARARAKPDAWRPVVVLRNPAARARRGVAELQLSATVASVAVGPGSAERQGLPRRVPPWRVDGVPLQILDRDERVALTEDARAYPRADRVATVRALGWVEHIGGYSVVTRAQRRGESVDIPNPVRARERALSNALVHVSVSDDGAVRLEDVASGRVIADLLALEDRRDIGDLYTPALRESLPPWTLRRVRLVHRGPLRGELALDYSGTSGRCTLRIQLDANLPVLRVRVEGENRAKDHRLRLRFATVLAGATTVADAAFHPVSRAPLKLSNEEQRMEHVVPSAPLRRWVARFTPDAGATIFSDGLAEYESHDDGSVAVTLMRSVGALSRPDLPERPGNAGWPAATPGAQSLGPFEAEFAVALHGPDSPHVRDMMERLADDVLLPIAGETLRSNLLEPREAGGLELSGEGLAFSSAMPAQRAGWFALRCVNRRDVAVQGAWRLARPIAEAVRARLDETPEGPLRVNGSSVSFEAAPKELVTVLVLDVGTLQYPVPEIDDGDPFRSIG
ncbi:MAG TPA: glycoside hydrolase family 38 C-terminal domain-containing protein [Candidatus Elarobacter sp.]|nr:glycoside hydrolase family 38 C-terminal domain-containing protein [Candidatus Elarobacter sp.]